MGTFQHIRQEHSQASSMLVQPSLETGREAGKHEKGAVQVMRMADPEKEKMKDG